MTYHEIVILYRVGYILAAVSIILFQLPTPDEIPPFSAKTVRDMFIGSIIAALIAVGSWITLVITMVAWTRKTLRTFDKNRLQALKDANSYVGDPYIRLAKDPNFSALVDGFCHRHKKFRFKENCNNKSLIASELFLNFLKVPQKNHHKYIVHTTIDNVLHYWVLLGDRNFDFTANRFWVVDYPLVWKSETDQPHPMQTGRLPAHMEIYNILKDANI